MLAFGAVAGAWAADASKASAPPPAITAVKVSGAPDAAQWQTAPAFALIQQDPHPGEPTAYPTTVRVLADGNHLYVRVEATDPEFGKRSVHTIERDSDQSNDDHVTLVLDTFAAQRSGYVFQVNAGGGRSDGLVVAGTRTPSFDWDGIWDAQVERNATGWVATFAIDTRHLQFRRGLDHWGFNVQRYVPRDQLSLQWSAISLDASVFDLDRMGSLAGVGNFEQGHGIEITPYALARHDSLGNKTSAQVGGDVRYNVTPDLAVIATFNPDFAEAEADAQQINLTRFSLFYPEKRRFFLEGSNQFAFSAGLADPDRDTVFVPFYSRRIGMVDGNTVRLDEGVKVIGSTGPWSIGALDVETGRFGLHGPINLFAGHLTYDVDEHLRVGTMLTRGDPTGQTDNQFEGIDAVWQTATFRGDKNLTLAGWAARTEGDHLPGDHDAWGLFAQYPNDLWNAIASINQFGDAFDPALGFLPRPGTRQYDVYLDYRPRPTHPALHWAHQFFYQLDVQQFEDLHGNLQTRRIFTAPFNVDTDAGEHFEFDWIPETEVLSAPFEISPGVVLPVGSYRFDRYRFETQSSNARPWQIGNVAEIGTFYDGRLIHTAPFIDWTALGGKLRFELSNETDWGYLREGNFIQRLYAWKVAYSFNPNLSLASFVQYDSTIGHVGINARLHWIVGPGRDLFLVFDHGIESAADDPTARLMPVSNQFVAKLRWDLSL
ncbi:MAG: carbohydrate binding family 9 domain-containing protein [Proteobacteria bacterium]|nr:carbohydrate binding family 9 domain-containing protein [Pseudomonadota bacterium]